MFRVTKHIDFCYGHRLLNYEGKCRHLHGHNGRVEVHIEADKLDARGLNRLQRTGTLPTVWIPPGALRDQRALPRPRRMLTRERTRLKHRIHATLAQDRVPARGRQCPG